MGLGILEFIYLPLVQLIEITNFAAFCSPVIEVCQRYRHGVRGILKAQTEYLVSKYLEVEVPFQVYKCRVEKLNAF